MTYDAVITYHDNAFACGVAKFNHALASRLGVPCLPWQSTSSAPLVSVKPSEMTKPGNSWWDTYDLLLHDRTLSPRSELVACARRVFYADAIGCPSTVQGNPSRGSYRVLSFGMSHKRVLPHFEALKAQLDREHPDYTLSLSTAVHEGSPWDTSMQESEASLRALFGEHFRFLGFLADDALAKELQECDAVAMYFSPALRKNNTSYWAAVEAGKTIYTNRDELSPKPEDPPVTWASVLEALGAA